jgi:hypothetical protein
VPNPSFHSLGMYFHPTFASFFRDSRPGREGQASRYQLTGEDSDRSHSCVDSPDLSAYPEPSPYMYSLMKRQVFATAPVWDSCCAYYPRTSALHSTLLLHVLTRQLNTAATDQVPVHTHTSSKTRHASIQNTTITAQQSM